MTDKEIIKTLECCWIKGLCNGCPLDNDAGGTPCRQLGNKVLDLINRQQTENERLNNELHSKVEYIHELLEIIENNKKEFKRYEDLKKAENILDFLEQDAFKRSIYNTIDTIKQLENEIAELQKQKMVGN